MYFQGIGIPFRELQHCNKCNKILSARLAASLVEELIQEREISHKRKKNLANHSRTATGMLYLCIVNQTTQLRKLQGTTWPIERNNLGR